MGKGGFGTGVRIGEGSWGRGYRIEDAGDGLRNVAGHSAGSETYFSGTLAVTGKGKRWFLLGDGQTETGCAL